MEGGDARRQPIMNQTTFGYHPCCTSPQVAIMRCMKGLFVQIVFEVLE